MRGEPFAGPLPKPSRRAVAKKQARRQWFLTRRQCREKVYLREGWRCQRCGREVTLDCWPWEPERAHVNELLPKSRGGDPCDPANCELLCNTCHITPAGEHCPTPERMQRLKDLAAKAAQRKREARG